MSHEERPETDGQREGEESARTFTEEQAAIFSNPHGMPAATRPRTPCAESVAPGDAEPPRGVGGDAGGESGPGRR